MDVAQGISKEVMFANPNVEYAMMGGLREEVRCSVVFIIGLNKALWGLL